MNYEAKRIASYLRVKKGWFDGEGEEFSVEFVRAAHRVGIKLRKAYGKVYSYPHPEGTTCFEWDVGRLRYSVELTWSTREAYLFMLDLDSKFCEDASLKMDDDLVKAMNEITERWKAQSALRPQ